MGPIFDFNQDISDHFYFLLSQVNDMVDKSLVKLFDDFKISSKEDRLIESSKYMLMNIKGKRIRPFLIIITASILKDKILKNDMSNIIDLASIIEVIHSYSLIHDDLPSMDNDDYRRGQKSCHKKYDEATAILTGDILLTYVFYLLSNLQIESCKKVKFISDISYYIGHNGMAKGQMLDILYSKNNYELSSDKVMSIQDLKTGCLFLLSSKLVLDYFDIDNKSKIYNLIISYTRNLAKIFQIKDDLNDYQKKDDLELNICSHLDKKAIDDLLNNLSSEIDRDIDILDSLIYNNKKIDILKYLKLHILQH